MSAHTPAEWAAVSCAAVSAYSTYSAFYFLLVDANRSDFDPRPVVRRAIESGRLDGALIAVTNAKHDARTVAARAAALLALLLPTTGGTR